MDDLSLHVAELIEDGYITKDGTPLKCPNCQHAEFSTVNAYSTSFGLEEYSLKCDHCGNIVGHWAYGNWDI